MTNWHSYPAETRAAVAALARGSCYFPGCRTPILVLLDGRPVVNVEVTHLRTNEPGAPRYVAGMTRTDGSFSNVLLLCVPHRKTIDRDEKTHPIDLLETWGPRPEALAALGAVTAEQVDELLTTAFGAVQDQIDEALSRFEKVDPDSAHLLRSLMHDLGEPARSRSGLDHAVSSVRSASSRLENLVTKLETASTRTNIGWTTGA